MKTENVGHLETPKFEDRRTLHGEGKMSKNRVHVFLQPEDIEFLEEMYKETLATKSQVIRQALHYYKTKVIEYKPKNKD